MGEAKTYEKNSNSPHHLSMLPGESVRPILQHSEESHTLLPSVEWSVNLAWCLQEHILESKQVTQVGTRELCFQILNLAHPTDSSLTTAYAHVSKQWYLPRLSLLSVEPSQ